MEWGSRHVIGMVSITEEVIGEQREIIQFLLLQAMATLYCGIYSILSANRDHGSSVKIPWKRKWQSTPVFLPKELQGQRSLAGRVHRKSQTRLSDWTTGTKLRSRCVGQEVHSGFSKWSYRKTRTNFLANPIQWQQPVDNDITVHRKMICEF